MTDQKISEDDILRSHRAVIDLMDAYGSFKDVPELRDDVLVLIGLIRKADKIKT